MCGCARPFDASGVAPEFPVSFVVVFIFHAALFHRTNIFTFVPKIRDNCRATATFIIANRPAEHHLYRKDETAPWTWTGTSC
jgi:hypothetical protein